MKYLIRKNSFRLVGMSLALFLASSCTKDFEGLNQDKKNISDKDLTQDANEGGFLLPGMMNNVLSTTTNLQTQQNLLSDSYANYLESPGVFIGNVNTITYVTKGSTWTGMWDRPTSGIMDNWLAMKKKGYDEKYPDLFAIATILKVAGGHRIIDSYGAYPYIEYGQTAEPKWDSAEKAYAAFFADLDKSVDALKAMMAIDVNADVLRFAKWDRTSLKGKYTNWIKLANSLRLRLGIRISEVDPALGKTQAEKAVNPANGGLLDQSTGSFSIVVPAGNPYYTMSNAWSDTRISAAVVTYLEGFGDSRLPVYAFTAEDPKLKGTFKGIRPGVQKDKLKYGGFSKYNVQLNTPLKIIDGAESYFLRAEGALRGWNMGGTPQELYEAGIKASFALNGAGGVDDYLQSTRTQTAYVDPTTPGNNSPAISDVTVKWDESLGFEKKLEKIITQKWITMFPEGQEAWSEFRRTGYPKLYHILDPQNPLLPLGTYIKRLTFPVRVATASQAQYDAAVSAYLGGKDDETVKFYWMTK
jgi:hypothetical protein